MQEKIRIKQERVSNGIPLLQAAKARCKRTQESNKGRTEGKSVKSGDIRGGFDSL
jgi:hypothetical protein